MKISSCVSGRLSGRHLVARLAREDVRRADARVHLHERTRGAVERRRGDTDVQHDDVPLGRVVRHRVGAERRLGVRRHQIPHLHLVPVGAELLVHVHVRELDRIVLRNVDLDVAAAAELQVLTLRKLHHELLEEGRDIAVRNHRALPLLHAQNSLRNPDLQVVLHLHLASQTPVVLGHLPRDEARLRGQDVAAALQNLALTHPARTAAAARRGKEYLVVGQRRQKRRAALRRNDLLAVIDVDRNGPRRRQLRLRVQKQRHQHQRDDQKGRNRY